MPRREYQERLDALRSTTLELGADVVTQLRQALRALDGHDDILASTVIEADEEINAATLELERECIQLLTTQNPVASDLRTIAASFKIATDLERAGDLATNLAGYNLDADRFVYPEVEIRETGALAVDQLEEALTAYEERDAEACYDIADHDDRIDDLCEQANNTVVRGLIEKDTDPEEIEGLLDDVYRLLLTVRDIERVGDHAVNVAARTLYMVEGKDDLVA